MACTAGINDIIMSFLTKKLTQLNGIAMIVSLPNHKTSHKGVVSGRVLSLPVK